MKKDRLGNSGGLVMATAKNVVIFLFVFTIMATSGVSAQRRQQRLIPASPTPGALKEIAEAVGAATYEELPDISPTGSQRPSNSIDREQLEDKSIEYQTYQGVVGRPSIDFPVFPSIPQTYFECKQRPTGYYADLETDCQVFHICDGGRKISFLCPNGTIFHQSKLICDWWFKVDCLQAPEQYEESAEHLAEDQRKAERTKQVTQHQTPILSRRSDANYEIGYTHGDNHVSEYTAEASFNTVSKSAPTTSSTNINQNNNYNNNRVPQNPRSFQRRPDTTRQQFVQNNTRESSKEENTRRRTSSNNNYNYASTRRPLPDYTDAALYRTTTQSPRDVKDNRESQVLAETASFASGRSANNYYFSQNYDSRIKTTTAIPTYQYTQTPPRSTRPTYTTTYTPGTRSYVEVSRSVSKTVTSSPTSYYSTAPVYRVAATVSTELKNNDNRILNHRLDASLPTEILTSTKSTYKNNQQINKERRTGKSQEIQKSSTSPNENVRFNNHRYETPPTDSLPFYASSIPTIAPRIYNASTNKFLSNNWYSVSDVETTPATVEVASIASRISEPSVAEHAAEMMKTLEELDVEGSNPTSDSDNISNRRPGLIVPPSAGPNTLHSLAIYFATAVDNLASTPYPTTDVEEEITTTEQSVKDDDELLLTRNTVNGYNTLFRKKDDRIGKSYRGENNDLESAQSSGLVASSPQIRELAQVFTHALSAYLQDPETFRKILAEIRPTEPAAIDETFTTTSSPPKISTQSTDFYSSAKEEDEVLDFSDVSKGSSFPTGNPIETTTYSPFSETKAFNIDLLRNKLLLSSEIYRPHQPQTNTHATNKSPASDLVTHQNNVEDDQNENDIRYPKKLSTNSPSTSTNDVAIEINGGLSGANQVIANRFGLQNDTTNDNASYFPLDQNSQYYNNSQFDNTVNNSSPYGEGVRPSNYQPLDANYYSSPNPTESVPIQWGGVDSTGIPAYTGTPSFDLVPPGNTFIDDQQFVTEDYLSSNNYSETTTTTSTESPELEAIKRDRINKKYKSHSADRGLYYNNRFKVSNENDEQLQRAHSQSFVSSANQLGRQPKKIEGQGKSNSNSGESYDKTKTYAIKTSTGEIISLPTLKDILSMPTSTAPTQERNENFQTSPIFSRESTTEGTTLAEVTTTKEPSSTVEYETTTVFNDFAKSSTRSQGSTSQYNIWSTSAALGHLWETTVFLDPLTINNGLANDEDSETIIPSANTYGSTARDQNIETTVVPQTAYTQEAGASQYTSFTTPFRINVIDYTTTAIPPVETTNYPSQESTDEILQQSHTTYVSNGHQDVTKISNPTEYYNNEREGKSLSTLEPRFGLDKLNSSDVDQTMMTKAKEMFGGLNDSSADTLMNVMKSADKNKTVRRLILLLIQTCDDDHNKTLEASRNALLDALMKIPTDNNDVQETVVSPTEIISSTAQLRSSDDDLQNYRRSDEIIETQDTKFGDVYKPERRGKNLIYDPTTTPSSTTTTTTTEQITTTAKIEETSTSTTAQPFSAYTFTSTEAPIPTTVASTTEAVKVERRGRKYYAKSSKVPVTNKFSEDSTSFNSGEKPSVSTFEDHSVPSDTRALELLRSLYSLAARWG